MSNCGPTACVRAPTVEAKPEDDTLACFGKALAHPVRVRILRLLATADGCVCGDVVGDIGLPQSTVSQHLKVLKDAGLVCSSQSGRQTCYCLNHQGLRQLRMLIAGL